MNGAPERPFLAFDTSTGTGSVAVGVRGRASAEASLEVGRGASSALLPAIDWTMRAAGVERGQLAGVVVGGGPGSFTGVRVAAATAKGIVHVLGIPLFAPSSLLAVAAGCAATTGPVCALFDARRRDVYAACYGFTGDGIAEQMAPAVLSLDALLQQFRGGDPPLFAGEGALLHREELRDELGARVAPSHLAAPRAAALLWAAHRAPHLARAVDAAAWEPLYIRASGAERIAAAG